MRELEWGPKPFKFFNAWLSHPNYLKAMKEAWESNNDQGWATFRLFKKLQSVKEALKVWKKVEFGDVQGKLSRVEEDLHSLDIQAEHGSITGEDRMKRRELKAEMWKLSRCVERMWMQKARTNWALNGDRNTKFFHIMVSARQRRNHLDSVIVNEECIEEPNLVKQAVFNHFHNLYKESWKIRPMFVNRIGIGISIEMAHQLVAEFDEHEVWDVLRCCDGNKSPGPDGFNLLSIKKCWDFMKGGIMEFMNEFHRRAKLPKGINSSFITLIPKVENPVSLTEYRPISLIGSMYKILSKVLAARIKVTIPVIVGEVQSAFSKGKNIQDGILIANEVVDS